MLICVQKLLAHNVLGFENFQTKAFTNRKKNCFSPYKKKYFRKSFKFHPCFSFDRKLLIKLEFYRNILFQWSSSFFCFFRTTLLDFTKIFFNDLINTLILKSPSFRYFSDKGLNFVYQLVEKNGNIKSWSSIKEEFDFGNFFNFRWQHLIYALPLFWKR